MRKSQKSEVFHAFRKINLKTNNNFRIINFTQKSNENCFLLSINHFLISDSNLVSRNRIRGISENESFSFIFIRDHSNVGMNP